MARAETTDNAVVFLNKIHDGLGNSVAGAIRPIEQFSSEGTNAERAYYQQPALRLLGSIEHALSINDREGEKYYQNQLHLLKSTITGLKDAPDFSVSLDKLSSDNLENNPLMKIMGYFANDGRRSGDVSENYAATVVAKYGATTADIAHLIREQSYDSEIPLNDKALGFYEKLSKLNKQKGNVVTFTELHEQVKSNPYCRQAIERSNDAKMEEFLQIMQLDQKPNIGKFTAQLASGNSEGFKISL